MVKTPSESKQVVTESLNQGLSPFMLTLKLLRLCRKHLDNHLQLVRFILCGRKWELKQRSELIDTTNLTSDEFKPKVSKKQMNSDQSSKCVCVKKL